MVKQSEHGHLSPESGSGGKSGGIVGQAGGQPQLPSGHPALPGQGGQPPAAAGDPAAEASPIRLKTPEGWTLQPARAMRDATYSIGTDEKRVEVVVSDVCRVRTRP